MRKAALALALLLAPCADAASLAEAELRFSLPADVGPGISMEGSEWILLLLDAGSASGRIDLDGPVAHGVINTQRIVYHDDRTGYEAAAPSLNIPSDEGLGPMHAPVRSVSVSSIFVEAETIQVSLNSSRSQLLGISHGQQLRSYLPREYELEESSQFRNIAEGTTGLLADAGVFSLEATGIRRILTHGVEIACDGCPDGRDRTESTRPLPTGHIDEKRLRFHELIPQNGSLRMQGTSRFALSGGHSLDFVIDGKVRLPMANQTCGACIAPQDETLTAWGTISMRGFQATDPSTGVAFVGGDILEARIDERAIDPAVLWGGGSMALVAAGLGLAALVKVVLAPLFTRLSKQEALEHPKRQAIFHYIRERPGANFREVARNTGIAAGTVRHHLTVLERAGHIVEHPHQGTVRLFENHGKFDHDWSDLVLLREPPLAKLHDWLRDNPSSPQKAALEAMERDGWSRSTTQHRLSRLVEGGIATIRLQGRLKMYSVVDRRQARPAAQFVHSKPAGVAT